MQTLDDAIRAFLRHRRGRNVAHGTLALYTRLLRDWQRWRAGRGCSAVLRDVAIDELRGFLAGLGQAGKAANTVESYRRVFRAFWRYLDGEGALSAAQQGYWANGRIPRALVADPAPRPYCDEELLQALLAAVGDGADEESARNRALLLLLYESGARVGEVCSLTDGDVDHAQRRAGVLGKGRRRGYVFWGPRTGAALLRYLALRRGPRGGPLFRGISSRNNGGPLTPNAVRLVLKRLGVPLPKGSPVHCLRHGFAHRALDAGLDISQVQQLMRHRAIETTLRYTKERPDGLQALHRQALGLGRRGQSRRDEQCS